MERTIAKCFSQRKADMTVTHDYSIVKREYNRLHFEDSFVSKVIMLVFLFGLLTVTAALAAEKDATALKVKLKNGTTATYVLSVDAKITFENACMCFISQDWKFEVPVCDLSNWTYYSPTSSVNDVKSKNITITQSGNKLTVTGAPIGSHIDVYATDGKRVVSVTSSSEREDISTEGWNVGVYLIKVNDRTFKIARL